MNSEHLKKPLALITGANRGIGLEVARQLGQQGWLVLLGCRNAALGDKAAHQLRSTGIDAHAILLDVSNPLSIDAATRRIEATFRRLDALVNNAAIHYDSWESTTEVDWEIVSQAFDTNTLGPWRIALQFWPLLKQSKHPRIVNVSSEAGSLTSMSGAAPAYSLSKAGLNAVTRMLASALQADGILVNAVCPGWTATAMGGGGGRPIDDGAASVVWGVTLPDDGPTGGFFRDGEPLPW